MHEVLGWPRAATIVLLLTLCSCERAPDQNTMPLASAIGDVSERALLNRGLEKASESLGGEAVATEAFSAFTEAGDVLCAKFLVVKPSSEKEGTLISTPGGVLLFRSKDIARWERSCSVKLSDVDLPAPIKELEGARARMAPQRRQHQFRIE